MRMRTRWPTPITAAKIGITREKYIGLTFLKYFSGDIYSLNVSKMYDN